MYILEGNIGSGKSTLLGLIQKYMPYVQVAQEPVDVWTNPDLQDSLLAHFCADMPRWSYSMETYTMFVRVQEHLRLQARLKDTGNAFTIVERSLYSGRYCFAKNGYLQGYMSPLEWQMYTQAFDFLVNTKCLIPTGFIYLNTTPETCYERAKKRSRADESLIPLVYFEQLHERHQEFLINRIIESTCNPAVPVNALAKHFGNGTNNRGSHADHAHDVLARVPVLVLDGHINFESNSSELAKILDKIDEFLFLTGDARGIAQQKAGHSTVQKCCSH